MQCSGSGLSGSPWLLVLSESQIQQERLVMVSASVPVSLKVSFSHTYICLVLIGTELNVSAEQHCLKEMCCLQNSHAS
jgi:hypothetical protein